MLAQTCSNSPTDQVGDSRTRVTQTLEGCRETSPMWMQYINKTKRERSSRREQQQGDGDTLWLITMRSVGLRMCLLLICAQWCVCVCACVCYMYSCMYVRLSGTEARPSLEHRALMDVNVDWRRGVPRGREHGQRGERKEGCVRVCVCWGGGFIPLILSLLHRAGAGKRHWTAQWINKSLSPRLHYAPAWSPAQEHLKAF